MATATHLTWLPLESTSHREAVSDPPPPLEELIKGVESFHPDKENTSAKKTHCKLLLSQGSQCVFTCGVQGLGPKSQALHY